MINAKFNLEVPHSELEMGIRSAVDAIEQSTGKTSRFIEKNPDTILPSDIGELEVVDNNDVPYNVFVIGSTYMAPNPRELATVSVKTK